MQLSPQLTTVSAAKQNSRPQVNILDISAQLPGRFS